ncbi:aminoglycoside phosphotransferase family protein [Streptomyces profundus]|uniref:aminoglycoside phosphotransferase family protein n=1 Tax=Streptomyces profundus TaxID=2867410 RepID=UPI001D15E75F|nr:aminoglycoside phosphotransferase family protein [Streptomyces sp. MA3_2.13]UED83907.1 aminoglycoside phosphotransferase family protein [Streptomyces sp. MA3_2.13]
MGTGQLIGSGRSADVFAIDRDWVLRRYRNGDDATVEAEVMAYLAERGYPVPRVRAPEAAEAGVATAGDLVLRRLRGPSMLVALGRGTVGAEEAGATLGALLNTLHAIPARLSTDPAVRVLHLDLHPDNVMLTPAGPMVIDWCNSEEGPPGLDWAMSALILAQVAVGPMAEAAVARAVLPSLLRRIAPSVRWGNAEAGCLAEARARRAADPAMSEAETGLLDDAVRLVLTHTPPSASG